MTGVSRIPGKPTPIPAQELAVKLKTSIIKIVERLGIPLEAQEINKITSDEIRNSAEGAELSQYIARLRDAVLEIYANQKVSKKYISQMLPEQSEFVKSMLESIQALSTKEPREARTVLVQLQALMTEFKKAVFPSTRMLAVEIRILQVQLANVKEEMVKQGHRTDELLREVKKLQTNLKNAEAAILKPASPGDQKEAKYPGTVWRKKG